jgi:glycine dehydrogenase
MVGMQVVVTKCDADGNVDLADLEAKCAQHRERLAAVMITYPSTYGVFESRSRSSAPSCTATAAGSTSTAPT